MNRFNNGGLIAKLGSLAFLVSVATATLVLPGCGTTSGVKVEASDLSFITKGKTTKAQLVEHLGEPTQRTTNSKGDDIYSWSYSKSTIDAKSFIPFAGFVLGGGTTKSQELEVRLNKKGIVSDYQFSDGTTSNKLGS
jgi:outer membrane protein assembly factor BamE (lipoprotein component of BamABCDE complex)